MQRALGVVVLAAALAGAAHAQPGEVESRIVSVGLFKNGLALVARTVTVPGRGDYVLADVPEPVHGTFWIESDARVQTRVTTREVAVPIEGNADLATELAGKEVVIHFRDGAIAPVAGRAIGAPAAAEPRWERRYEPDPYSSWRALRERPAPRSRFLIIETDGGLTYVDTSMVAYAEVADAARTTTRRQPVLVLSVLEAPRTPATIAISYLAGGMAWAPSYRVDISDPGVLELTQKAVVRNELEEIEDAEIYLISGFPSVQFASVTSPLAARATWADFFRQLSERRRPGHAIASNVLVTQQAVMAPAAASLTDLATSAMPAGEGPDLHYQPIGRHTLAEGDSLALEVASGTADYERIVEWLVPDNRGPHGRPIPEHERRQDPEKYRDAAWDAVRFRNPLAFPMTTGPAMVVAGGRFLGQRTSYWVNAGEQNTLHVTKALSIRTRAVEHEVPGERQRIYVAGDDYQKTSVGGELTVSNHRNEPVKLLLRRRFSGELLEASGEPETALLEEGVYSVNRRNELVWTLTLQPGERAVLTYTYSVLVDI
ncbi:MAG: hypothetical protein ACYS8K_00990 [Planctomycetota bacterium]|jgi:hypothetical protein